MFGLTKRIALIVLSVWLILSGLFSLAGTGFTGAGLILNPLAIGAGVGGPRRVRGCLDP